VGFKGLSIAIGERKPEIVWCDGAVSPKCFFADDEGYIFSPAPQYSDNIFYSLVGGLPAEAIGTKPLPTNSFQNIVLFAKLLPDAFKKANFNDGSQLIRVVASTTGEYTAVLRNNKAEWRILFNDGDATETIKNLVSVLSCDAFKQDLSTNKTDLDYLNLRIGKKVFYRFK
jgi:hypothetical protein